MGEKAKMKAMEEENEVVGDEKGLAERGVELVLPAPKSGVISLEPRSPTYI